MARDIPEPRHPDDPAAAAAAASPGRRGSGEGKQGKQGKQGKDPAAASKGLLMDGDLVAVFRNDPAAQPAYQSQYPHYMAAVRPRALSRALSRPSNPGRHPSGLAWSTHAHQWPHDVEQGILGGRPRGAGFGGGGGGPGPGGGTGTQPRGCLESQHWVETVQQYCQSSSLHGLRYVGDTGISPVERCFWVVSFALAVVMAAYFITNIYQRWEHNPVINSVAPEATPIFDIPFPAVTICNMNRARLSVARTIKGGSPRDPFNALQRRLLSDVCDDTDYSDAAASANTDEVDRTSGNWSVVMGFMINVTQPCHELLLTCLWRNLPVECDNLFNAVLTDEGICCTFNRVRRDLIFRNPRELSDLNITFPFPSADWTPELGYPDQDKGTASGSLLETPWRPLGIGTHLGLTISLDSELHDYYCSSTTSAGFKMVLHNPVETPKIAAFGALVEPGTESRVAITPLISHTAASLQAVSVDKRQCLFEHERYLNFYRTYTQRNCILECEANFTLSHCKCVAYYMPKDRFTRICGKKDEQCANIAREAMELRLANGAANLTHLNITDVPACQCLPGCSELSYTFTHSSSHFAPSYRPEVENNGHRNTNYLLKNSAVVHFYFTDTLFPSRYKGEIFGFTEFLSNSGGILGLFLGFSFLSVVEIAYFLSLRIYCSWSRSQNITRSIAKPRKKVKLDDDDKHVARIETIPYLQ